MRLQVASLAGLLLSASLILSGCVSDVGGQVDPLDPYGVEFESAIAESSSDFVRKILADHVISVAEYDESQESYLTCLKDEGIQASLQDNGTGHKQVAIPVPPNAGDGFVQDSRVTVCLDKWVGGIARLYEEIEKNPKNEDWNDLVAACFVREGLALEGFSGQDLSVLEDSTATRVSVKEGEQPEILREPLVENAKIPGTGILLDSIETVPCFNNPLQTGVTPPTHP